MDDNSLEGELKADIGRGIADVVAGRVKEFDAPAVISRGKKILESRLPLPGIGNAQQ